MLFGMVEISVVIPTWNNARRLELTLDALAGCTRPTGVDWEILVVANGCSDDTDLVLESYRDELPISCLRESRQGVSHARNLGIQHAKGRLVIFSDDDVRSSRDRIAAFWQAYLEKGQQVFLCGPLESEFESQPPPQELLRVAPASVRGFDLGSEPRMLEPNETLLAGNFACDRDVLRRTGSFDGELGLTADSALQAVGEETDLIRRLRLSGYVGWYVPDANGKHFVPDLKCTLEHFLSRERLWGRYHGRRFTDEKSLEEFASGVPLHYLGTRVTLWLRYFKMLSKTVRLNLRYVLRRARFQSGYAERIELEQYRGMVDAVRERLR